MQLVDGVTREERAALLPFADYDQARHLKDFTGTIINLPAIVLGGGFKEMPGGMFGRNLVPNLAVGMTHLDRTTVDIADGHLIFDQQSSLATRIKVQHRDNSNIHQTRMPPLPQAVKDIVGVASVKFRVLYEAKNWEQLKAPPRPAMDDPALLEHLIGDLWMVRYSWDLSPLEKRALERAGVGI